MIFILNFVDEVYHVYSFACVELSLHLEIKKVSRKAQKTK